MPAIGGEQHRGSENYRALRQADGQYPSTLLLQDKLRPYNMQVMKKEEREIYFRKIHYCSK